MLYKSYESESLPEYHKNLLIVKVDALAARRGLPIGMTPMWWRPTAGMVDPTPGVAALAYYERSGLIKRVTPLGPTPPAVSGKFAPPGVMSIFTRPFDDAVGAATDETSAAQFSRGVSVVELEEGANLEQLQLSIAADPFVSFASRVPVRYLMGARNTSSVGNLEPGQPAAVPNAAGGGATIAATPPPAGQMWNMRAIRWQQARDNGLNLADSVKVAVLDTGIDLDHPDLPGTEINYIHEYPESGASVSGRDIIGHGTHVAGTIRALVNSA
jgi:subtilisin family serine protease